ncbi:MAG: peptidoglycan DD-metalloendopeptidase family protein [Cytophagaceae bacterium]
MRRGYIIIAIAFIIAYVTIVYAFMYGHMEFKAEGKNPKQQPRILKAKTPTIRYGLAIDSMAVNQEKIRKNETWMEILTRYHVPENQLREFQAGNFSKELQHLRAGNQYLVYHSKGAVKCIVYPLNQQDNIILRFQDSLAIFKEQNKIDTIRKNVSAQINSSLYESLAQLGASPDLAIKIADIFADKVDFFRISKGDQLSLIYDQKVINGKASEAGKIYSACFIHDHEKFYAFNFSKNGKEEYFDEQGKSMSRGGFMKAPLKFFRISSKFSKKRFHPVQKIFKAHLGTDYAAPVGTPIHTVGDGVVLEARFSTFNGNYVKVKHNSTYSTQYLHMSKIAKGIKPGKKLSKGELIGYVGSTGLASGPHVCFRFWKNGKQIDGSREKHISEGEPVAKALTSEFNKYKDEMTLSLDAITDGKSLSMKNDL